MSFLSEIIMYTHSPPTVLRCDSGKVSDQRETPGHHVDRSNPASDGRHPWHRAARIQYDTHGHPKPVPNFQYEIECICSRRRREGSAQFCLPLQWLADLAIMSMRETLILSIKKAMQKERYWPAMSAGQVRGLFIGGRAVAFFPAALGIYFLNQLPKMPIYRSSFFPTVV